MATVTTKAADVTYVLELDEAEARYLAAALIRTEPTELDEDTVYAALSDALDGAGVEFSSSLAR